MGWVSRRPRVKIVRLARMEIVGIYAWGPI